MEEPPHRIIRWIQLGEKERVLRANTMWICLTCETCATRCPNGIEIVEVMDFLREMAQREGIENKEKRSYLFHRSFVDSILKFGRVHEASMLALYKIRSKDFFQDWRFGLRLLLKGKIKLFPDRVKNPRRIRELAGGRRIDKSNGD